MADKKISELDAITGANTAADDFFIVVDSSGSATKKISRAELNNAIERDVLSTVDIDGGTIDGTTIGGTTAAAGTFTDLTATGTLTGLISEVSDDTTPQLGGNLDLNSNDITGTGDINIAGTVTADGTVLEHNTSLYNVDKTLSSYAANNAVYLNGNAGGWLQLAGDGTRSTRLKINGSTAASDPDTIIISTNSATRQKITSGGDISFYDSTGVTQGLFWDASTQRLGLGTTSPSAQFHSLGASGTVQTRTSVTGSTASDVAEVAVATGSRTYLMQSKGSTGSFVLRDSTGAADRMTITSGGNVGIGTTSPQSTRILHTVSGNASQIRVEGTGTESGIDFKDSGTTNLPKIGSDGDDLFFDTSYTQRMTIKAGGNVGIGTTSPSRELHVKGDVDLEGDTGGVAVLRFKAEEIHGTVEGINIGSNFGGLAFKTNNNGTTAERMRIDNAGKVGINTTSPSATLTVNGSVSKSSGSFKIDHPIKPETHDLVHSFVEAPQADNIYRGKIDLVDGSATVNIDTVAGMTQGTFVALNRDIQCFTSNESGWTAVKGSVSGNVLTITAQDNICADTISWLVVGERHDSHMYDAEWTDENGRVIVEPEKVTAQE